MKSSGGRLHDNVNVLDTTNCALKNGYEGKFYVRCNLLQLG